MSSTLTTPITTYQASVTPTRGRIGKTEKSGAKPCYRFLKSAAADIFLINLLALPSNVISGPVDVLPGQRGHETAAYWRRGAARTARNLCRPLQKHRMPKNDGARHQV